MLQLKSQMISTCKLNNRPKLCAFRIYSMSHQNSHLRIIWQPTHENNPFDPILPNNNEDLMMQYNHIIRTKQLLRYC